MTETEIATFGEEFDEKLLTVVSKGGFLADVELDYEPLDFDVDALKSFFIQHATDLIEEREKKMNTEFERMYPEFLARDCNDLLVTLSGRVNLTLLTDKKDLNS